MTENKIIQYKQKIAAEIHEEAFPFKALKRWTIPKDKQVVVKPIGSNGSDQLSGTGRLVVVGREEEKSHNLPPVFSFQFNFVVDKSVSLQSKQGKLV